MEAKLIVVRGKANKGEVVLTLPTTIGRSRDSDLTVAHPMVSRNHCEIFESDGKLMVRDLGSLNGTFVNGERVTEAELPPQAEITVGPLTFRAEYQTAGVDEELPMFEEAPEAAFQDAEEADAAEDETRPVEKKAAAASIDEPDFSAFDDAEDTGELEVEPADEAAIDDEAETKPDKKKMVPGKTAAKPKKKEEPAETEDTEETATFSLDDLVEEAEAEAEAEEETISSEASVEEEEELEGEEDEQASAPAAKAKGKQGKEKKGWWPFKKDEGVKKETPKKKEPAEKELAKKEPAKKESAEKELAKKEPAKKESAPAAKKETKPVASAKKAGAKRAEPDLDDLAFAAVQGDEEDTAGPPAGESEEEDLDNFLKGLQ